MQRSISSVLRRVIDYSLSLALFFVFEAEESEDAALSVEAEASLCLVAASWRAVYGNLAVLVHQVSGVVHILIGGNASDCENGNNR